ncbi:MAG: NAD(P)/FAD-dependent oxidoreductase [Candidatus Aegiribacteria sp.]|nr:NAD(P)/FAD-dependent oxidoreductase [Candidatus Aegiribacteria sp.]
MHDVAVIGTGPAGCAAAVQCRRLGLDVALVDTLGKAGGLIREARLIENYPGLEKPLAGPAFADRLISILSANDLEIRCYHADSIALRGGIFEISGNGESIRSQSVIVAVGTVPKDFSIQVSGNVKIHRSILELKQQLPGRTVIVGGGEAAVDYALNLSDSGSSVSLLVRGSRLKAVGKLRDKIERRKAVKILYNTGSVTATASEGVIQLEAESSGRKIILETDALLAAVGREPRLPRIMNGFVHERGNVRTSIQGLYVSGDASLGSLGQAAMASGQGLQAALYAFELLKAGNGKS